MSTPLFQPNRSTYRVFSTRPEIPLGDFTAPPYRHPEVLFPFPQCQPLATGSSSGPEIESEVRKHEEIHGASLKFLSGSLYGQ
jgi:hypothetical protein